MNNYTDCKNSCFIKSLKLYNLLIDHNDIKKLNINLIPHSIDRINFQIEFRQLIFTTSGDIVNGILVSYLTDIYGCCNRKPHIIETALIGKDDKIIYDEDLGYVDVCHFSSITELTNHLYNFADGVLYK